jgi:hypothetical protein
MQACMPCIHDKSTTAESRELRPNIKRQDHPCLGAILSFIKTLTSVCHEFNISGFSFILPKIMIMIPKLLSPKQHGYMDYGFAAALLAVPSLIGMNATASNIYTALGCNVLAINGTTDHGLPLQPMLSLEAHRKIDLANIALLYGLFTVAPIIKDKKALRFHSALTALATLNVLLTDYKQKPTKRFADISKP